MEVLAEDGVWRATELCSDRDSPLVAASGRRSNIDPARLCGIAEGAARFILHRYPISLALEAENPRCVCYPNLTVFEP